jgi:hypothetical protein
MKSCPTCQRTFPDNSPDACPYDGARLVGNAAPQQQYYAGGQQAPPYGAPGNQPPAPQWPPPPPAQNYGGYQQPGQYATPYGSPYAPAGSKMLSTLAFVCGLVAFLILVAIIVFAVLLRNGAIEISTALSILQILQPLSWLMLAAGGASIVLGIVALVTAGKNPAISKAKAIVGMCLGAIPVILFLIGIANTNVNG